MNRLDIFETEMGRKFLGMLEIDGIKLNSVKFRCKVAIDYLQWDPRVRFDPPPPSFSPSDVRRGIDQVSF